MKINFFNQPKIEFELTKHCNLNCLYCGAYAPQYKQTEMDFRYFSFLIKILSKNKQLPNIILSGGEPTLHSKFNKIIKKLEKYNFNIFLISNLIKIPNIEKEINIIFSIHLDYLEIYLRQNFFNKIKNIINSISPDKIFQFQFVLPDFTELKNKNLLIKFKNLYSKLLNKNTFVHYQFIIDHKNKIPPEKFNVINFKNIKQYRELLFPFIPKPFFYNNNFYQKYICNLKRYRKQNFNFKNFICENNNFKVFYDFKLFLECNEPIFLHDLKKDPFKINIVTKNKKLSCPFNYCDFQLNGYCKKYKKD